MPLPTCAVSCTVHDQEGQPVQGARIEALLNRYEVYQGHVVPSRVVDTTDALGMCTLDLWPNQLGSTESAYTVKIFSPGGKRVELIAVVPNFANANLHEIATLPVYPGKLDGQASIEAAQAAGNTAIIAAQASQTAATESEASRAAAVVARDAAQASATAASASAGAASASAGVASGHASAASLSAGAASTSAGAASGSASAASASAGAASGSAVAAEASAVAAAQTINFRNLIVNGDFWIDQLVLSGTIVLAANQMGVDGWRAGPGGCTYTRSYNTGTWTITITAGTLRQTLLFKNILQANHTVGWDGTAQGRYSISAGFSSYFSGGSFTLTNATTNNVTIEFNTGTLRYVQVQPGLVRTAFAARQDELQRCQVFRWKTYVQATAPGTVTSEGARGVNNTANAVAGASMSLVFPVEMLGVPNITFYNPVTGAAGTWRAGASDYAMGNAGITAGTNSAFISNTAAIATVGNVLYGHVVVEVP